MLPLVEITAFRLESNFTGMRPLELIRDHVTFKLPYDFSYHMKTPVNGLIFFQKTKKPDFEENEFNKRFDEC